MTVEQDQVSRRRQFIIIGTIFAVVLGALVAGYLLFLRSDYVVLAEGMRANEASAVVAELDKRGVAYKLQDGGTTVLVPEGQADATRLAIAGSQAAASGEIGFELFNKSDMGLTSFAQKINYQRALQGELTRTIMQMDGVDTARVHLALPERTLFRDDRQEPTAAVTVAMRPGQLLEPGSVSGIQRLVAASVPDLPAGKVVVLNAGGHVVSQVATNDGDADQSPTIEEQQAVESYHRARARAALETTLPGVRFVVKVATLPLPYSGAVSDVKPSKGGSARNYGLRVTVVTSRPLSAEDQGIAQAAIEQALVFNPSLGDVVLFEAGPLDRTLADAPSTSAYPGRHALNTLPTAEPKAALPQNIWWIVAALLAAALIGLRLRARRRALLSAGEHEAFALTLRRQLAIADGRADAAR